MLLAFRVFPNSSNDFANVVLGASLGWHSLLSYTGLQLRSACHLSHAPNVVGVLAPLTIAALVTFLEVSRFGIHLFLRGQRNYPKCFHLGDAIRYFSSFGGT